MEHLMILLVVVPVTLSRVLSCPYNQPAMEKEIRMCTVARLASAGQNTAEHQGRADQCLKVPHLLKCIYTIMTYCEGVPYVEADRADIDAAAQRLNATYQQTCVKITVNQT
ncbi:hypothetical protein V1264_010414 [Littorina saxatilis]|uniref:Secreted protein n=1 Tax=Littorina saxatilis TaxID=31220 RepID=A0AAN9G0P9_9CAEN